MYQSHPDVAPSLASIHLMNICEIPKLSFIKFQQLYINRMNSWIYQLSKMYKQLNIMQSVPKQGDAWKMAITPIKSKRNWKNIQRMKRMKKFTTPNPL